jgi:hypothetical protein
MFKNNALKRLKSGLIQLFYYTMLYKMIKIYYKFITFYVNNVVFIHNLISF